MNRVILAIHSVHQGPGRPTADNRLSLLRLQEL